VDGAPRRTEGPASTEHPSQGRGPRTAPDPSPAPRRPSPEAGADGPAGERWTDSVTDRPIGRTRREEAGGSLRIPFLRHPADAREETEDGGQGPVQGASSAAPPSPAHPPIANPRQPATGSAPSRREDAAPDGAERKWPDVHFAADPSAFLALAARVARPRARAAEEPAPPPAMAARPALAPADGAPAAPPQPAPDVTELMDAIADEIQREYRRHYGE
jgi:hypothetical protein